ncbi:hypothetical protein [Desulfosporosinus meridiei]|uniref:Acetyltransferase, ribosomal protein N-acetylase n=1 Tax=Desulfosporosinus meridiei (strain ATCC BAA-275 / DSM 13257 / KCTC 12902 / NCIMB 13706 / S10) TaxID=768704 RepID=J7IVU1_DESMD|nr:hypothetical protein [Desulfosporosinus meridiei]AFQ44274.1 hypothetical protein Desmer_2345 [Desulfosporosinus meridiei DSM 13257]
MLRKMNTQDIPLVEKWLNKEHVRKWFGIQGNGSTLISSRRERSETKW